MNRTVVIAGAGPVGLMLAGELRLAGVPVVVLERLIERVGWARSLFVQNRSVEVLRQRGLDWFGDSPRWVNYNFGFLNLRRLKNDRDFVPFYAPQHKFEELLEERAVKLGTDLRRGHEVVALEQDDSGVRVQVRTAEETYELQAAYLVGCDGGRSAVRKLAGIDFPGTDSTVSGITAWVTLTEEQFPKGVFADIYPTGIVSIAQLEPGMYRATSIDFETPLPPRDVPVTVEEFKERIHAISGIDMKIDQVPWISRFGNATRLAAQYRQGGVLLAGDAAHIHFASAAQGLNTGIQDAVNLGWKLAAEINGWAPPGLLDSYHTERHPVGRRVCMFSQAQVALYHPLDRVGPLRELLGGLLQLEDVSRQMLGLATGVDIHYEMPSAANHPLVGRRIPDADLTGGTTVFSTLREGRGVLLDFTGDRGLPAAWSDRVETVHAEPVPDYAAARLLVRPDGYVAFADPDGTDDEGLRAALTTWFGTQ
ncbi:monooxygenase [Dactylosporangium darangshiense]|uniref:Monooxygenase n=1 Tax=Dactylosporangium darangshiense TaxID=579108 RepID=A0ABP8DFP5_9ACTN